MLCSFRSASLNSEEIVSYAVGAGRISGGAGTAPGPCLESISSAKTTPHYDQQHGGESSHWVKTILQGKAAGCLKWLNKFFSVKIVDHGMEDY